MTVLFDLNFFSKLTRFKRMSRASKQIKVFPTEKKSFGFFRPCTNFKGEPFEHLGIVEQLYEVFLSC